MERGPKIISYREDPTEIGRERDGQRITRAKLTQMLELVQLKKVEEVGFVACRSVGNFGIRPQEVFNILNFIDNNAALDQFRVWCSGKGYRLHEEEQMDEFQKFERAKQLLADEADLIDKLNPYVTQLQMARILGLRKYREAYNRSLEADKSGDEKTKNEAKNLIQTLISGSYRLLGEYLGPRRFYKRAGEEPKMLPLPELPEEIFEDDLVSEILIQAERDASLEIFNQDVEQGFAYLNSLKTEAKNEAQVKFVEKLETYFKEVDTWKVPEFKKTIAGSQKDVPIEEQTASFSYPSFHQKEYAYRFIHKDDDVKNKDFLVGDTGTQKTGAAIYAMEAAGTKTTLVVCPPGNPVDDWGREIEEKYEDPVEVVKIVGRGDLEKFIKSDKNPRYIIIGFSLLSSLGIKDTSFKLLADLVQKGGVDSLVDDEAHLANEYDANCTQLMHFISGLLPKEAPRIAMTATGVVNGVEDLDSPVRILLPFDYPIPGDFTRAARNDPNLVGALLYGRGLITRWDKHSILKGQLPDMEIIQESVVIELFHKALYDFVYADDKPEGITKRQMLRQALLDPMLVKKYYSPEGVGQMIIKLRTRLNNDLDDRARAKIEEEIKVLEERSANISNLYTFDQALTDLSEAVKEFINWKFSQNSDEIFDEDFLVRLGMENLAIWAFFNLPNGVDSLVRSSTDKTLREEWRGKEGLYSSKYRHLRDSITKLAQEGKNKFLIFSAFYKTAVTTPLEEATLGDDSEAFFSLYDYMRIWFGDETTERMDGDVTATPKKGEISARDKVRRTFRLDPTVDKLVATQRVSRLGINLTIPPIEANKDIIAVHQYHLDPPDTYADRVQTLGRSERTGQIIPIKAHLLRATHPEEPNNVRYGFLDEGIEEAIEYKRLIAQMTLDGIPITEEEEKFVKDHSRGVLMQQALYPMTPRMYLINRFFPGIRGQGYKANMAFLKEVGFEGMPNADFFATYYPKDDEYSLAGHNARVVSQIIKQFEGSMEGTTKIASVGAGAGILQIMLGKGLINIDMMHEILQAGKARETVKGEYVTGEAAHIPTLPEVFEFCHIFSSNWVISINS